MAWQFACAFYVRPGLAEQLVRLQDEQGVDVPLLLVLLSLSKDGKLVAPASIEDLIGRMDEWRRDVVQALRSVRRLLKSHLLDSRQDVYRLVKEAEFASEKIAIVEYERALVIVGIIKPKAAAATNLAAYRTMLCLADGSFDHILAHYDATLEENGR